jgi:hypothetical protein
MTTSKPNALSKGSSTVALGPGPSGLSAPSAETRSDVWSIPRRLPSGSTGDRVVNFALRGVVAVALLGVAGVLMVAYLWELLRRD